MGVNITNCWKIFRYVVKRYQQSPPPPVISAYFCWRIGLFLCKPFIFGDRYQRVVVVPHFHPMYLLLQMSPLYGWSYVSTFAILSTMSLLHFSHIKTEISIVPHILCWHTLHPVSLYYYNSFTFIPVVPHLLCWHFLLPYTPLSLSYTPIIPHIYCLHCCPPVSLLHY